MKRGNQKGARLRPDTSKRLLRLDDKHSVEVPWINSFLEERLLLSYQVVEATHTRSIVVPQSFLRFFLLDIS